MKQINKYLSIKILKSTISYIKYFSLFLKKIITLHLFINISIDETKFDYLSSVSVQVLMIEKKNIIKKKELLKIIDEIST